MGPNIQSRRPEALSKFTSQVETDLTIKTSQTMLAADAVDFENQNIHEPDSATLMAEAEMHALSQLSVETHRVARELNSVREQLLSAGCETVGEGSLVTLQDVDDDSLETSYLIVPNGSGNKITLNDGTDVICMSPEAPLAKELIGLVVGDEMDTMRDRAMSIVTIE